jgi:DNA-binding transcriptional LysR family regulator
VHVDLNLLAALDALLDENSVQGAAERLHLSAPAMSRTLARIRKTTGDDILVRTGRTMTPTPRALELRDEVHSLVQRATEALSPTRAFDLSQVQRTFVVRGHDALLDALAETLIPTAAAVAPGVTIQFLAEGAADTQDLTRGHVDLEIGSSEPSLPEISFDHIGDDHLVVVFRPEHHLATSNDISLIEFADGRHVTVSRRGRLRGPIDDELATLGLHRTVIASLPTSSAALHLAASTDVVVHVADALSRRTRHRLGLVTRIIPIELPAVPIIQMWHRRFNTDPGHMWLRTQVRNLLTLVLHSPTGVPR